MEGLLQTSDGQIFVADNPDLATVSLAKIDDSDAPNGVLQATPLRVTKTTGEHFKITWQDSKAVAFHTLAVMMWL